VDHQIKPEPDFVQALQNAAWYKLENFNSQDLSNTIWAIANLSRLSNISIQHDLLDSMFERLSDLMEKKKCRAINFSSSIYSLDMLKKSKVYQ
jgi:hypothetical protein